MRLEIMAVMENSKPLDLSGQIGQLLEGGGAWMIAPMG